MKEFNSPIPKALSTVLAGLGNTTCPNDLKFRLVEMEYHDGVYQQVEIPGYFGEDGPNTQPVYKSYPCVAVYAQRILAEVNEEVEWNLPEDIRPANPRATNPNSNLLGYRQAMPLSNEQKAFLSKVGITRHNFNFYNGSIALNIPLILAIQRELSEVKGIIMSPFPNVSVGSSGQLAFCESTSSALPGIDFDENQILRSFCKISNPVAFVSSCAKYRSNFELGEVVQGHILVNWCICDYVDDDIPG